MVYFSEHTNLVEYMIKETKGILVFLVIFLLLVMAGIFFLISENEEIALENGPYEEGEGVGEVYIFECPSENTVKIAYYDNSDSAKVIFNDEEYSLNRAVSGSGARYTNEDESVIFWEHQGEALLEIEGETVAENCRLQSEETGSENEEIENAIIGYLLTQQDFSSQTEEESRNFCIIENLHPEKEFFPYYAWVRCGEFILVDEKLEELSGTSLPVKIDYPEDSLAYDTEKFTHEIPRDGSYYTEDIEEMFPENVREEMLEYRQRRFELSKEKIELEALKWFSSPEFSENENMWEKVKEHIEICNVKEVFQSHDRMVRITLKNDEIIRAVQPELDDVFKILQDSETKKRCKDNIIMSTE